MGILLAEGEAAGAAGAGGMGATLSIYAVLIGALWFFMMSPQKK